MNPQTWLRAAPGRHGLARGCADRAEAGRVVWYDDDDDGVGGDVVCGRGLSIVEQRGGVCLRTTAGGVKALQG